jgi:hypothetical protein
LQFKNWKETGKEDKETMTDTYPDPVVEELKKTIEDLKTANEGLMKKMETIKIAQDKKKLPPAKKPDPPLISIKEFLSPSKPISYRPDLTPKSRASFTKFSKK